MKITKKEEEIFDKVYDRFTAGDGSIYVKNEYKKVLISLTENTVENLSVDELVLLEELEKATDIGLKISLHRNNWKK